MRAHRPRFVVQVVKDLFGVNQKALGCLHVFKALYNLEIFSMDFQHVLLTLAQVAAWNRLEHQARSLGHAGVFYFARAFLLLNDAT